MKTLWICIWLFLLMPALAFAGQTAEPAAETDTVKTGWWVVGMEASNNSSFFGRNTAKRYPYAAPNLTYIHHTGIWASASAYQLFGTEDFIDQADLSVGYSFKVRKRLEVDLSYTHFIFGKNTPLVNASTTDALSARTAYDWKYLYTALTNSYIIGSGNDVFTVLENSRYVPLNPLWQGNLPVGLDPKISVTAGTQHFSETHTTTTTQKKKGSGGGSTGSGPIGGILDPLNPGGSKGPSDGGTTEETTTTTTTTNVSRFRVLNYDLKIPVVVYYGNFEFEPSWRYSIPVNKLEGDESKAQSFYTLSVKYTF
ncbi:hypothetical protein ABID22_002817 [Pontibacter aydingkolensis]|uniref:Uncharacterized protein n=1 Tax=Pontibacter aydingkolensis TaxID=1911536 RepID=A0ABS7CXH5_9BACT|nr:hypothetical protein [Pontibacter aydingkolensis]MBW7468406.1 hypothetical protein [Pontibacter aydingkolensis]